MIERKLIVGRFLNFTDPRWPGPGNVPDAQDPAAFVTQDQLILKIEESTGVFKKTSDVTVGAHATKEWRTFGWLSWVPGSISEVEVRSNDVLTGPMSGCDLVLYKKSGIKYFGHLGTEDGNDELNRRVKSTWNGFANSNRNDVIAGFNPMDDWEGDFPRNTENDVEGSPQIYGVCTATDQFYVLVLYAQKIRPKSVSAHPTLKRIAGLRHIRLPKTMPRLGQL